GPDGPALAGDLGHEVAAVTGALPAWAAGHRVGRERDRLAEQHAPQQAGPQLVDEHRHATAERLAERDGAVDPEVFEHREDVGRHEREPEAVASRWRVGAAVAAQVDGDGPESVAQPK